MGSYRKSLSMNSFLNSPLTAYQHDFPHTHLGRKQGFRHRAKLAVRGARRSFQIGHFKPGTHEVVSMESSPEHSPIINQKVQEIKRSLIQFSISIYQEKCHQGLVRYLQLTSQRGGEAVELAISVNIGRIAYLPEDFILFLNSLTPHFTSIWLNLQNSRSNVIFSPLWHRHHGDGFLSQKILGTPIFFHPGAFMQSNLDLFERAVESIQKNIHPGKKTLELYAGVGAIGRNLPKNRVTFVEINPFARCGFPKDLSYVRADAASKAHLIWEHEVVIVDPPRKGLDREIVEVLQKKPCDQLIYLSCNYATLARDLSLLPNWEVTKCEFFDFFPRTPHIETLVFLEPKSGQLRKNLGERIRTSDP